MGGIPITLGSLEAWVTGAIRVFFTLAGVAVVAGLAYAAFLMVTTGSDPKRFKQGKDMMVQVLVGGAIIFGVGLIVNTVANFAQNPEGVVR
jgi:hypothetical protein